MNIEALWAVQFTGANAARIAKSGGVIVTETDRIFGGDTWMWYTGDLSPRGRGAVHRPDTHWGSQSDRRRVHLRRPAATHGAAGRIPGSERHADCDCKPNG
jgi:hypothetical protein